ncbi:hypothetical protein HXX76_005565 [Chlamydomonas incerta]|uniref:Ubiquitin-like domain-containing protein n=1 Tax=Chlamydomonas incerta TaxID=51695 RepID=A0A835W3H7_CHLIN|nr:hypothetical protein HXX76_005565 [Chlamydomonas incerta]|eukprot:KAG2437950.1 hypothetical protein HXX76_005565 [Chlamydomonas incerta]
MATPPGLVLGISLFRPDEAPQHSAMCVDYNTTVADVRSLLHHQLGVPPSKQRWLALQQRHAGCQLYMPAGNDNTMVALMLDNSRTLASYGGLRPDLEIHAAAAPTPPAGYHAPPETSTQGNMTTIDEGDGGSAGACSSGEGGGGCAFGFGGGLRSGASGLSSAASVAAGVFEDEFAGAPQPPAAPSAAAAATSAGLSSCASDSCVLSGPRGGYCQAAATESTTAKFAGLMFARASAPAAPIATAASLFSLQHPQPPFQGAQCPPALFSAFASEVAGATGTATASATASAGAQQQQQWLHSASGANSGRLHSSGSHLVLQPSGSLAAVQRLVGDMYESYEDPNGRGLFVLG